MRGARPPFRISPKRVRSSGVALLSLAGALVARAPHARADDTPAPAFSVGARPVWYLMGGVTGGGTLVAHGSGYAGGELSVVRLLEGRFFGVYGDSYYDFGARRTYATTGVELGYKLVGIDAGGALRLGGDRVEGGATGRVFVTVGVLSVYGRYAYFPDSLEAGDRHVVQIGGLLKWPFETWGGGK